MMPPLPIAKSAHELCLLPGLANRHGLITGATGTGKTVTLQTMAEAFSSIGVPALNIADLMQTDEKGRGIINILAADRLMNAPKAYATLLLWLLSELFEALPEVGDPEKPKLVFFFDEAHLLFNVERAFVLPPHSRIGPVTTDERTASIKRSPVAGTYEQVVDRESAYEVLKTRREQTATPAQPTQPPAAAPTSAGSVFGDVLGSVFGGGNSHRQSAGEAMIKSAARAVGSELERQIIRGVLGSILGSSGRRG